MVYFAMAMALFAEEDYEEVAARLSETLVSWGCWDDSWGVPTSGGITQARQRLGPQPLELLYDRVAERAALVYLHSSEERQHQIADTLSKLATEELKRGSKRQGGESTTRRSGTPRARNRKQAS
jgi:hypothetical protein